MQPKPACLAGFVAIEYRGVAQPGSAPAWGAGGRRFKSSRPDQFRFSGYGDLSFPAHQFR